MRCSSPLFSSVKYTAGEPVGYWFVLRGSALAGGPFLCPSSGLFAGPREPQPTLLCSPEGSREGRKARATDPAPPLFQALLCCQSR